MKNISTLIVASLITFPVIGHAGSLFPQNPVPMSEGYGKDGAGTHFAVPEGIPGPDCVVNPVSLKRYEATEVITTVVPVTKFVEGDVISIPAATLFDFDKDFLREEGKRVLTRIANRIIEGRTSGSDTVTDMTVIGHTDSKGTDEYNIDLGLRRANTVRAFLNNVIKDDVVIRATTEGEHKPIAPNTKPDGSDDPEGRQLNRRVDLRIDGVIHRVTEMEQHTETKQVLKDRNPQIFHVLADNNRVFCDGFIFGGPQYFWWSGR